MFGPTVAGLQLLDIIMIHSIFTGTGAV